LGSAKKTELVVDLLEHGVTSPRFTENPAYKVTSNSYEEFPGELTQPGVFQMEKFGQELRKEFIEQNQFLPNEFRPENFYHKSYKDQPSSMSAYATMLGAYPESVSWIQFQSMGSGSIDTPFTRDEESDVRKSLGLSENPNQLKNREMTIWAETDGRTFFNDPLNNCPQMHKDMAQNLDATNQKFTDNSRFDALYEEMEKTLGVPDNTLTFKNAHLYLDDYVSAQANNKPFPQFEEQIVADSWISNYYRRYYYEGKYGDNLDLSRVASNHFFNYVLTAIYGKYKTAKGEVKNDHYEHLKYAQFVGNENSLIAADKLLNDNPEDPILPPRFGSNLRFELFENGGEYFVKTTIDGNPVKIKGDIDGVLPYDTFMKHIYGMLYFGDVNKYCVGQESVSENSTPNVSQYEQFVVSQNSELREQKSSSSSQTQSGTYTEQRFIEIGKSDSNQQDSQIDVRKSDATQQRQGQQSQSRQYQTQQRQAYQYQPQQSQGNMIYNYQNEAPREYSRSTVSRRPQYSQSAAYSDSQAAYTRPVYTQNSYQRAATVTPPIQLSQNAEFSNMVETSK
jgi:hypothetical protein